MFVAPRLKGFLPLIIIAATFNMAFAQFGSGVQYMQAVTPEGQLISVIYQAKGQTVSCGIHVKELAWESRYEGGGTFVFVHDLKLVNNKMECAYGPKNKLASSDTTFTDVDYRSGHILMTVARPPLLEPNKKYQVTLTSPFKGTMIPFRERRALP